MDYRLMPFEKKTKKTSFKDKEKELACSLFEVEKFLSACSCANKCNCFAKFLNKHFGR